MAYGQAAADANLELKSKFRLEVDNISLMAFEGLKFGESTWGEIKSRTGVDGLTQETMSGLKQTTTIEITKKLRVGGAGDIAEILNWHTQGSKDRRGGSIIILDRDDNEVMRFNFKNAWVLTRSEIEFDASDETGDIPFVFTLSVAEVTAD